MLSSENGRSQAGGDHHEASEDDRAQVAWQWKTAYGARSLGGELKKFSRNFAEYPRAEYPNILKPNILEYFEIF